MHIITFIALIMIMMLSSLSVPVYVSHSSPVGGGNAPETGLLNYSKYENKCDKPSIVGSGLVYERLLSFNHA